MSPADRGLQIPERKDAPVVEDPAVVAGKKAKAAFAAYLALPHSTVEDEATQEFKDAEQEWLKAGRDFADTPATTIAGMFIKLRALVDDVIEDVPAAETDPSWEYRHAKTILAFLEGFTGTLPVVADDPAVVEFTELKAAWTAFDALPDEVEEQIDEAAYTRVAVARDAVRDAVPVSLAGVAGKVRALLEPYRADPEAGGFDHDHDISAKSMLPFLEGVPPTEPDPVVALFAEWGEIRDEATALGDSDPKATDPEINERWENAIGRCDALEDQIMETPATSMRGVAIKIRIASHYIIEGGDVDKRYATPARDIDYVEATGGPLDADGNYLISALRDAERLAGV